MKDLERLNDGERHELEEHVASIFELPDEDQGAAFDALRRKHPHLAELLRRWERAAGAIDASELSSPPDSPVLDRRGSAPLPERIGPYEIRGVLGEGGMGVVYLAEQHEPVRRRVALKVVRAGLDSQDVLSRFEAERQAVALMTHPNIAKVLDAGETDAGQPYFALEHVPGLPFTEYCDREQLGLRDRIRLFQIVCQGVQHAHQKGIIHRDLKPGNVLVQDGNGHPEPKIIDFGVAKALEQRLTPHSLHTEPGRVLGTPEYMSPEQARMSWHTIDTRSDIYSLGVMLYEVLAGVLPFDPAELRRAGYVEMQRKIHEDVPKRPSTRCSTADATTTEAAKRRRTHPHALARALHGDLDWIVMRCLEKDPARRYASASELAADLQRHLDDEPVLAGPPSMTYRLGKFLRKRRGTVAAATIVLVALIAGLSVALWQYGEASDNLDLAARQLTRTRALNVAAVSARVVATDPVPALLLALKAVELDRNPETLGQVQVALAAQYLIAEFRGHTGDVTSADFGTVNRRVVTGSEDGTVRLWSEEGEPLVVLPQGGPVLTAKFPSDEQKILTIAARGDHQVARVLSLEGRLLTEIGGDGARPIDQADWHPATSRLLVRYADEPGTIFILDSSGAPLRELVNTRDRQWAFLFFSPEGHAVSLEQHVIRIWPLDGGEPIVLRTEQEKRFVRWNWRNDAIAFDPLEELIVTTNGKVARIWDRNGKLVGELAGHTYRVDAVQFSPSGETILTASGDGTARLWYRDGRQRAVASAGGELLQARFFGSSSRLVTAGVSSVSLWNDKGRRLAELRRGGRGHVLDLVPAEGLVLSRHGHHAQLFRVGGVEGMRLRCDGDRPWNVACHPEGQVLAGSEDGRVFAWDGDGHLTQCFESGVEEAVWSVACSPDGSRVVAGGFGVVHAWDSRTAEKLWTQDLEFHRTPVTSLFYLRNGSIWAHLRPSRAAYLIDPEHGTHELLFNHETVLLQDPPPGEHVEFAFARPSPDREIIGVSAMRSGHVLLYDAEARKLVEFEPHENPIGDIAFHPDGKVFATASPGGPVHLWDLGSVIANPRAIVPMRSIQLEDRHGIVDFSPCGTRMLIAKGSHAYVTDLEGNVIFHFGPAEGEVGYIVVASTFSPDGKWIIGEAYDGARRWVANEDDLLRMARKWADRLGRDRDLSEYEHLWR